jgi:hypothetical protein
VTFKKWIAIALFAMSAAACKQGIGERCEVDEDCTSGTCSQASPRVCVSREVNTDQIDAMLPCDAPCDDKPAVAPVAPVADPTTGPIEPAR